MAATLAEFGLKLGRARMGSSLAETGVTDSIGFIPLCLGVSAWENPWYHSEGGRLHASVPALYLQAKYFGLAVPSTLLLEATAALMPLESAASRRQA